MDFSLKKCCRDRLSSLPDELISQILSSLPTKDAAIASLSFKKMRSAFMYLTTLDFDDSPISYCAWKNPQLIERFPIFKAFVDNVLRTSQSPHLNKFRLGFGGDVTVKSHCHNWSSNCGKHCFPDLESTVIDAWIDFPLRRCGVKEIDLRIHVSDPGKLPSALFSCESLEVLKLDTNLDLELVSGMPSFRLPNLKVLKLDSIFIPEDEFMGRLVSNCPLLEELCVNCWWKYGKSVDISSPSLKKLVLFMNRELEDADPGDILYIDTPNLQYFEYEDSLALDYSVTSMKAPVRASINIYYDSGTADGCFRSIINLMIAVCNVQHLSLLFSYFEEVDYEDLKNHLPTFPYLKHLELDTYLNIDWDTVFFEFLMRSPVLEVLEFPRGIYPWYLLQSRDHEQHNIIVESEPSFFRKYQLSPYCCKLHLKRIVIKKYHGTKREVGMVRFLIANAPALEELFVICDNNDDDAIRTRHYVDPAIAESTLKKLPMASSTCSIIVQESDAGTM